jgi:hypothetical protein
VNKTARLGDWYRSLSKHIFRRGIQGLESLESRKLSIISFNYDRSFEKYFLNVLESQVGRSWSEAKATLARIRISMCMGNLEA